MMDCKVGVVIQARMGSTRLPGKVLKEVDKVPMLKFLCDRLVNTAKKYHLVVATSWNKQDDDIVNLCSEIHIPYFRGDEEDVLSRFYKLSKLEKFDVIVRLNSDCPFLDDQFVGDKIHKFVKLRHNFDYASTIVTPTYPIGLHVELMTFDALQRAHFNCNDKSYREHVTPYMYNNPRMFKIESFEQSKDLSKIRLTVDYEEDLIFTNQLIARLKAERKKITIGNVIELVDQSPELRAHNQHIFKKQYIT